MPRKKEPIVREPILGFVVTEKTKADGTKSLGLIPLSVNWEGMLNGVDSDVIEKVIGVLPAPADSHKVFGKNSNGELKELGYEFKGCYHPRWNELFKKNNIKNLS